MIQIANCFVCYEDVGTRRTYSKVIQIQNSVFQSNDAKYIEMYILTILASKCEIPIHKLLLLNVSVLGFCEE